jgi:hypothetical protein
VSTNGYIVGVEIDDGVTAPSYPSEMKWLAKQPREDRT